MYGIMAYLPSPHTECEMNLESPLEADWNTRKNWKDTGRTRIKNGKDRNKEREGQEQGTGRINGYLEIQRRDQNSKSSSPSAKRSTLSQLSMAGPAGSEGAA